MPYVDIVSSTASSGQAGLTAANNLRIASISIAAYEFVASSFLLTLLVTFIRPAFSPLSLPNSGYTRLQVGAGKEVILQDAKIDLTEQICGTAWVSSYSSSSGMLISIVVRALAHLFCRYLSIIVITISNTGFFYQHFSPKACAHYAYIAPVFKGTVLPYAVRTPEADKSSSIPGHGIARNPGNSVCLNHPVPRCRVRQRAAGRITLLIVIAGWVISFV